MSREDEELQDFDALSWSRKVRQKTSKKYFRNGKFDLEKWEKRAEELEQLRKIEYRDEHKK